MDLPAVIHILPTVTIAAQFGVRIANQLSKKALGKALGAVLLVVGGYMTVREWLSLP